MNELKWCKSTYSADYNCVEVAVSAEVVAVRDSKDRAAGHFVVSARQWDSFVRRLKQGTLA